MAPSAKESICQGKDAAAFSRRATPLRVYRLFWYLKTAGVSETVKKIVTRLWLAVGGQSATVQPEFLESDVALHLEPGEWVEIRSEKEILATLDDRGRCKGLQFMPQMLRYCGTRARVYKRLERVLFEESQQRRRIKNTVLLEGGICEGDGVGCDRSCFFFWREAWLRRVDSPGD